MRECQECGNSITEDILTRFQVQNHGFEDFLSQGCHERGFKIAKDVGRMPKCPICLSENELIKKKVREK